MTLELTGERTVPGIAHENYWFRRHEVAYRFAARCCAGLDVLDAGCGEGYGTAILAAGARRTVGVELVADVCAHVLRAYPGVELVGADVCRLPLVDACVDAVVSLQVIEHLWDIPRYLDETVRVLRPGGLFVCSTPNRLTFRPGDDGPVNPFHSVELTAEELASLLAPRFTGLDVAGVFHGARLAAVEARRGAAIPALLSTGPAEDWPGWLAELVASVTVHDFEVTGDRPLAESLDLIVSARAGGA